tara:strand:- start:95 stop:475 length:381 start_codon:yes stop_codon:yes gene_type:complete
MLTSKTKRKIFIFDMDDTICKTYKKQYHKSRPIKSVIFKINQLKENGHTVKIFTARYMGRNKENYKLVKKKYFNRIEKQLKKWNVNFDELILGKPSYDYFIDDKCHNINDKKTFILINQFAKNKKN